MFKKAGHHFEVFAEKIVKTIVSIILIWLTYWQSVSTLRFPVDNYEQEIFTEYADSPVKNILFLILFVLIIYFLQRIILKGDLEQQKKRISILAIIDVTIIGILLTIWVSICHIPPYWDQLQVLNNAQDFRAHDYSVMDTLYTSMYTQQYGLVFFEEMLLNLWNDYRLFQYINVIFIMSAIFLFYKVTDLLFNNPRITLYSLLMVTAFLPLHIFSVYVYGDIGSIALSMLLVWALLKWKQSGKIKFILIALVSACVSTLIRQNTLILLIAVLITLCVYAWKNWNLRPLIFGILLIVLPLLSVSLVKTSYEIRSDKEIGKGLPATAWIAMGLQEQWGAVGVYNGYCESIWWSQDQDPKKVSAVALNDIKYTLEGFRNDPEHAREFFRFKILEQWAEPTFSSLTLTGKFEKPAKGLVEKIYFGTVPDYICRFMNYYLFSLYFSALVYTIRSLFQKTNIFYLLLLICFIGGFLFGLIWEAKGRYMMPYAMMLIPFASKGLTLLQDIFLKLYKKTHLPL